MDGHGHGEHHTVPIWFFAATRWGKNIKLEWMATGKTIAARRNEHELSEFGDLRVWGDSDMIFKTINHLQWLVTGHFLSLTRGMSNSFTAMR